MSNLIGLAKARKLRDRKAAKLQADTNAIKFGLTKAQKKLDATREALAKSALEAHKVEKE